jgi:hypothetical protein
MWGALVCKIGGHDASSQIFEMFEPLGRFSAAVTADD